MTKLRRFKKVGLMSEVLFIEEIEIKEKSEVYEQDFIKDFQQEIHFLSKQHKPENKNCDIQEFPKMSTESLKKIYRELVKKTHPDINPDLENDNGFKEVQAAYDRGDGTVLLGLAIRNDIEIELEESDLYELEIQLQYRRDVMEQKKTVACWVWCNSNKSDEIKNHIRQLMGIDKEDYEKWLKS
tara:strand:+ start:107 stop:658 length:552 start_codon:yes stop_codon:yes gene_type:complete